MFGLIQDLIDNDNIYIKRDDDHHLTLYLEPREAHKRGYSRYKWVSAQEDEAIEERRRYDEESGKLVLWFKPIEGKGKPLKDRWEEPDDNDAQEEN